ncbi:MAG: flagellar protein FlaG [Paraglaciecola sp.]|nr:flagellar protein FlaG [Paraglaciecola sp.]NCT48231.1 flagellar protein FlaG [Paraglaciecola sp.]
MEINFSQSGNNLAVSKYAERDVIGLSYNVKQDTVKDKTENADNLAKIQSKISTSDIQQAVDGLSEFAKASNRQLNFSFDESSERPVVKVTDAESGEVIRQIPTEEVLKLSERLRDLQSELGNTVGILFSKQV